MNTLIQGQEATFDKILILIIGEDVDDIGVAVRFSGLSWAEQAWSEKDRQQQAVDRESEESIQYDNIAGALEKTCCCLHGGTFEWNVLECPESFYSVSATGTPGSRLWTPVVDESECCTEIEPGSKRSLSNFSQAYINAVRINQPV